jgi:hypothetical protein
MSKVKSKSYSSKISLPKLVLIHSPSQPIANGKNRRKFPSSKDCCVRFRVLSNNNNNGVNGPGPGSEQKRVPIRYECDGQSTLENSSSLMNGSTYLLGVSSITRHRTNEDLLDLPTHKVCLYHPLNICTARDIQPGHYGFWFRFFGKSCRFHIMITLKLQRHGHNDKVLSTIELDITNIEKFTINRNVSIQSPSGRAPDSSLYSEKRYIGVMEKLHQLQEHCLWQKCVAVGDEMASLEKGKSDVKASILLEQSKAVCHQGGFATAKSLIKQAMETIPARSQNKDLLIARGYIYLSLCHHYELSLGNAEECLRIASEKLINFKPCEDTADLHHEEGWLLISFLLKIPNFSKGLITEAKERLEKAISHYKESYNPKRARIMNKIYNSQLSVAILFIFASPDNDSVVIAEEMISSLSDANLSQETVCRFSFVKALLLQQQCSNEAAITNAKHALDLATTCGLYVEKQLIVKCLKSLQYM